MDGKSATLISTFILILISLIGGVVTQEDPQSASFVNCSFKDGVCDWKSISAGWKIGQGSPTTSGTGSAHDHSLRNASRIYIYLDPKSVNTSQSQVLRRPLLQWDCLSFRYHICGKDTGNLTVSIETKETTMATKVSTTQSGNKTILGSQEENFYDKWHRVDITIQTQEAFTVLLVGTTKRQNRAIAVDDIQLSKCCCKDRCGVGFWNWLQRISDDCTRTFGTLFPGTTSSQSGCTNNSTGPQNDGTNAISTTRDLKEPTFSSDEAFTKTTRPAESNIPESYTIRSRTQITTQGHIPKVTVEVITVSLVGAVMFVILSLLVGVWICRTKRCSKQRNTGNASIQLPSYETLQHGINIGDYVNVVYSPIQSITECPSIPFPHNITSNNDNEYDYVS